MAAILEPLAVFVVTLCALSVTCDRRFVKRYGQKFAGATAPRSYGAVGALYCEKLCVDMGDSCEAVNVIYSGGSYQCDVMESFRYNETEINDNVVENPGGKLIIKQVVSTNVAMYPGTTCSASSQYNTDYTCDNAFDGLTGYGGGAEWSTFQEGDGSWIKLTFAQLVVIDAVELWHRCATVEQYGQFQFQFEDGTSLMVTRQCAGGATTNCNEPESSDRYAISPPVSTRWIKITGWHDCGYGGNNGLTEVRCYGVLAK